MSKDSGEVAPKKTITKKAQTKWKDVYQTSVEFKSRLFKLLPAQMLKKVILGSDQETIQPVSHQHFFHTFDSSGKEQKNSVAVGGHFHAIEISEDPETGEPIATCSGPKHIIFRRGKRVIADLPELGAFDDQGNPIIDKHTHTVEYQRTSNIKPRTVNAESMKIIDTLETSRLQPVEGIKG